MKNTPYASGYDVDRIRASADVIYEKDANTTYLGFCDTGTLLESEAKWSIMRIVTTADVAPAFTRFTWANGQCNYNLVFDDCETYDYYFKKF
jgi:hypothetical protein